MLNRTYTRLAQLREQRAANDDTGFTLIELLVVVVIIGILIAIAIPLYLNYENGAKNKGAESDTRAAVSAAEQCYADLGQYPATLAASAAGVQVDLCPDDNGAGVVNLSDNDSLTFTNNNGSYLVSVSNSDTGQAYHYDSTVGKVESGAS